MPSAESLSSRHLIGIEGLSPAEIGLLLNLSDRYVDFNRSANKKGDALRGRTIINVFFENEEFLQADVDQIIETIDSSDKQLRAMSKSTTDEFDKYVNLNKSAKNIIY